MFNKFLDSLMQELEASQASTSFGQGWISGVLALFFSISGLLTVIYLHYPSLLTVPEIHSAIDMGWYKLALNFMLITGFAMACISLILRQNKLLGATALVACAAAIGIGSTHSYVNNGVAGGVYFGMDWFVLNLTLTGIIFLPLERLFRRVNQPVFRVEWREDMFYFLLSSLMVQSLSFLSLAPSKIVLATTEIERVQSFVISQPGWLQFMEIMLFTDIVQYWLHRAFHTVPFLWRFHAIHHSAKVLDWLAGSRMHIVEIVFLRGLTIIPMQVLGFHQSLIYLYLIVVYVYSTYIHSNVRFDIEWIKPILVTPRFHHWHHGSEPEAIDVNFAVHFSFLDRLFGTYHMPVGRWPKEYGVVGNDVPSGYLNQFKYPFKRRA
jgi:sterol desaturase/sphingolipid hydroxylase (fatty acid hydroxylase superfamily)